MNRWTQYHPCIRWPGWSLAIFFALAVFTAWRVGTFEFRSDATRLLSDDLRNSEAYAHVQRFLEGSATVILIMDCGDQGVFHEDSLKVMEDVETAFRRGSDVAQTQSLTNSSMPYFDNFQFKFKSFLPPKPWTTAKLEEIREFSVNHPLVRDLLVSQDGRQAIILLTFREVGSDWGEQQKFRETLESIVRPFQKKPYRFSWIAAPLVEEEIRSAIVKDSKLLVPAALGVWVLTLSLFFGFWKSVRFFIPIQILSLATLPWGFQYLGSSLSAFSLSLFPALAGIHLTWLTHIFSGYQSALTKARSRKQAMGHCMTSVFKASCFAALTTLAALGALAWFGPENSQEFGKFGCIGTVLLFLLTFGPGLSWAIVTGGKPGLGSSTKLLAQFTDVIRRFATGPSHANWKYILIGTLILGVVLVPGWLKIKADVRAVDFLNKSSPTRQFAEQMDEHFGGINLFQIEIDSGRPNGANSLPFLRYIKSIQDHAELQPGVSTAYSYASVIEMLHQIWRQKADEPAPAFQLPESAFQLGIYSAAIRFQQSSFPFLNAVIDNSYRKATIILRSHDMESGQYLNMVESIIARAEASLPENVSIEVTEGIHNLLEKDKTIAIAQSKALGISILVVAGALLLLWRSLKLTVLALGINLAPILMALAVQGWAGIPLNSITAMSAALTFGIAIDDAVHLITAWSAHRRKVARNAECNEMDPEQLSTLALNKALEQKTTPILCTTLTLSGIFALFTLSYFPPVKDLGVLTVLALIGAGFSTLFLAPKLMQKS